jgi:hypothetical protein
MGMELADIVGYGANCRLDIGRFKLFLLLHDHPSPHVGEGLL